MPRSMVGLLAAVGSAMSALVGLSHGELIPVMVAGACAATGLAAYLAAPSSKKSWLVPILANIGTSRRRGDGGARLAAPVGSAPGRARLCRRPRRGPSPLIPR